MGPTRLPNQPTATKHTDGSRQKPKQPAQRVVGAASSWLRIFGARAVNRARPCRRTAVLPPCFVLLQNALAEGGKNRGGKNASVAHVVLDGLEMESFLQNG
jgi:hypothetical protein